MLPDEALPADPPNPAPPSASGPGPKVAQAPPSPAAPPGLYGGLPSFPAAAPKIETGPLAPQHARPRPQVPAPRQPRLQDLLAKDFQPLYALLDASREPS